MHALYPCAPRKLTAEGSVYAIHAGSSSDAPSTLTPQCPGRPRPHRTAAPRARRHAHTHGLLSQPISEQTNVFAAQEFGWFREVEIEFTFVPGAGGGAAVKNVLAGNADIAFANLEPLFFAADGGEKLKAVYNIYPQNVFNVVSPTSKNITKPQDLKGKRIGVYSLESGTRHNLRIILRSVGLDEKDVEVVPTGVLNFGPLLQGQVDATAATDTGLWAAQQQGLGDCTSSGPVTISIPLPMPSSSAKSFIQRAVGPLVAFLKAYKRGTQWMLAHPDEAGQLAVKHAIDGKDPQRNLAIIKLRNAATVDEHTRQHGLGWFDITLLEKVERTFRELGLTKNTSRRRSATSAWLMSRGQGTVVAAGADWIHFDVMDNHMRPQSDDRAADVRGDSPPLVDPIDVLDGQAGRPDRAGLAKAGANIITFHPEASGHVDRTLSLIRE